MMTNPIDFANALASHSLLRWDMWPSYGMLGVVLAGLVGLGIELRLGARDRIDQRLRGSAAFAWPARSAADPELALESESRAADAWRVEIRSRRCSAQNSDFFDTVEIDDDHLAFYLGEVSGHGVAAALYQASCKALLRFANFPPGRAADVLEEVNSVLCQREPDGRFATLTYGVLKLSTGEVDLVSAGQTDPILQRADGSTRRLVMPLRLPLSMAAHPEYKVVRLELEPGDRLLLATDGVTHARDRGREPFSHERMRVVSHKHRQAELGKWTEAVMAAVDSYNFRCVDDRTLLAISYDGLPVEPRPTALQSHPRPL